ncbi:MAG TPA: HAMP domain-containing histidine kinase [Nannocystis exedens]|nr:HAMP domain-containing histidine kinase [Nannocystis exedens]
MVNDRPPLRLRQSLAARIVALVLMVLFTTGASSWAILGQVRALQASFDLLTAVHVVFNARLTEARIQAARIYVRVEDSRARGSEPQALTPADEALLAEALAERTRLVQEARYVVDDALANPERLGGADNLADVRALHQAISRIERAVAADEDRPPRQVVSDIRTQNEITRQFVALESLVARAIRELSDHVRQAERETERATIVLTIAASLLALAAALGVIFTLRPLQKLTASVRRLGRGDWEQRIELGNRQAGDEVSQLAREFNLMAEALQERERRLIRGERLAAVGRLAAQVTHEIRNPLSSVALNAELLEDELESASPEAHTLLARITGEVDRLALITEDYLAFARRQKPDVHPFDLAAELKNLLDFIDEEFSQAGIKLKRQLPERAPLRGDASQLRQALLNLLRNAKEALAELPPGGRQATITLTLDVSEERVRVTISDNGPGIEGEDAERIFEAFYTRKAQGTGLGLAIVQQIVSDHDGTVRISRSGPEGTEFVIDLPACAPQATPVSSPDLSEGL